MEIKHIEGNTYIIVTTMSVIPFYKVNETEIILLDSGWAEEVEGIDATLMKEHLKVKGIINTHAHIDHIGNNAYFKNKYQCIIAMPQLEALICSSSMHLKVYYQTLPHAILESDYHHLVCETDIPLTKNDHMVSISGTLFKIIHTPGHSPSHICIVTPDDIAYIGDTLISYDVMESAKMPYAYILNEDLKVKESLYNLNYHKYILAHNGVFDNITKLISDNIQFYKSRAMRIYQLIDGIMSFEELLKVVLYEYNIRIKVIHKFVVIERMLRTYIDYLVEEDLIEISFENGLLKYKKKN